MATTLAMLLLASLSIVREEQTDKNSKRSMVGFGVLWIAANSLAWTALIAALMAGGWVAWWAVESIDWWRLDPYISRYTRELAGALFLAGLFWGAVLGVLQRLVLRRRFGLDGKGWMWATWLGALAYVAVQGLGYLWGAMTGWSGGLRLFHGLSALTAAASSAALGTAQWLVLRRTFRRSAWWIAAAGLAGGLAYLAVFRPNYGQVRMDVTIYGYLVQGLLYGAATLVVLVLLYRWTAGVEREPPGDPRSIEG